MKTRKPFVVGNWKMNGDLIANEHLFTALRASIDRSLLSQVEVAIAPPYPYLGQASAWLGDTEMAWGAQDVASFENGAFTGEVSASMLRDLGCRWVIVGHSERRTLLGETDDLIAHKAERALAQDIGVIVCVGETLEDRESDRTESVLAAQIDALARFTSGVRVDRFVVAYEPVWAIGTGRTASPEQAQQVHAVLRAQLAAASDKAEHIRLLYGGSMNAANAAQLLGQPDIDGGLVGGASLKAADCQAILAAAQ